MERHSRAGGLGPPGSSTPTRITSLVLFLALSLVVGPVLISSGCRPPAPREAADDVGAQPGPGGSSGAGSSTAGSLSPDLATGYGLAFATAEPGEAGTFTIYVSVPWTAAPTILAQGGSGEFAWRPDGRRLVYFSQPQGRETPVTVVLHSLDGSAETRLATYGQDYSLHTPGFSPDGVYLTLEDGTSVGRGLLILSQSGEELRRVGIYGNYVWSPDCSRLAFAAREKLETPIAVGDGCSASLRVIDPLTGDDILLKQGDKDFMYGPVAWMAADELVYSRFDIWADPSHEDYFALNPGDPEAAAVPRERPASVPPTHDEVSKLIPAELRGAWSGFFEFSPDGSALLFATGMDTYPYYTLRLLDLRTGAQGVVGGGGQAHWSPVPATAETGEG